MTFAQTLAYINETFITPFFNFALPFWGGITFGAVVVAVFGFPLLVACYKKFF